MSCIYRDIYLESDEFYQICLHLLSCIQVPLHILGTFIILKKTPKTMGRVKGSMLTLHLLTAFFDIYLSFLTMPLMIFPIFSGYPLGFLNYVGVPILLMLPFGYALVFFLVISIMLFFENRYNYLVRHDSDSPSRNKKRAIICSVNYFLAVLSVILMFQGIENKEAYREIALQKLPCLPSKILEKPNFVMLDVNISIALPSILAFAVLIVSQIFYYFLGASFYLYRAKAQSSRTSQLQKKFFKSLCIQICVALIAFLIPFVYFFYTYFFNSFDMIFIIIGMLGVGSHGLVSTTIMLLVHKPYREATLDIFGFKGRNSVNAASFIVAKPSISNKY